MTETEIIEFYSETKEEKEQENNDELTADGLPTLKKQLEMIEEDEQKNPYIINEETEKRNLLQSVKMLGLYNMGLDVFTDTRHINRFTREKLQAEMHKYNGKDPLDIINEFNNIICTILDEHKNIDKLPIYRNI